MLLYDIKFLIDHPSQMVVQALHQVGPSESHIMCLAVPKPDNYNVLCDTPWLLYNIPKLYESL